MKIMFFSKLESYLNTEKRKFFFRKKINKIALFFTATISSKLFSVPMFFLWSLIHPDEEYYDSHIINLDLAMEIITRIMGMHEFLIWKSYFRSQTLFRITLNNATSPKKFHQYSFYNIRSSSKDIFRFKPSSSKISFVK